MWAKLLLKSDNVRNCRAVGTKVAYRSTSRWNGHPVRPSGGLVPTKLPLIPVVALLAGCAGSALTVPMAPENNSGQSGTATLVEDGDVLQVTLELTAGNATGPQAAHIHTGTCAELGGPLHGLTNVVDGRSVTRIEPVEGVPVRLQALLETPHAINIHSADNVQVYVSCGDIRG
jgi:hypothetical protein